jgi:hypothetical protein
MNQVSILHDDFIRYLLSNCRKHPAGITLIVAEALVAVSLASQKNRRPTVRARCHDPRLAFGVLVFMRLCFSVTSKTGIFQIAVFFSSSMDN